MAANGDRTSTAKIIRTLIRRFAKQPETDTKISVADFLRLLAVLKEEEEDKGIREVKVTWVEAGKGTR